MQQLRSHIAALTTALTVAYLRRRDRAAVAAAQTLARDAMLAIWALIEGDDP